MSKKYISNAKRIGTSLIPSSCSFCENRPIGILTVSTFFNSQQRWVCNDCRRKFIKGELGV